MRAGAGVGALWGSWTAQRIVAIPASPRARDRSFSPRPRTWVNTPCQKSSSAIGAVVSRSITAPALVGCLSLAFLCAGETWEASQAHPRAFRAADEWTAVMQDHGLHPVGTRERIAIVRADRKWLVVGVTSQSISLLAELDEAPAELPGAWASADAAAATDATSGVRRFADLLRGESRRGPG